MSLFKVREFWSTQSEDDEYFDQNSLMITTLSSNSDFVVTGSQSGVLRIFEPCLEYTENNFVRGYRATDLLIEKILDSPILQIGCGRLVSGSQNLQIAVLHPRTLSVYTFKSKEGVTDHGTENNLEHLYEHRLRKSAANFIIGPFGGTKNRDFICVQSLDGLLMFFEQERYTFSCNVPDFLLPGPIYYVKRNDIFITSASSWCIVSYKYKLLSEAGEKSDETGVPQINYTWSYHLGEPATDISVVDDDINKETWIVILGERNLYCLNSNGKLKFMKRLDYSPICFTTYLIEDKVFSLVISETSTMLIYQDTLLKWSARLNFLPVSVRRAFLKTLKGTLVFLSEEGRLECCYLGTEPSLFVAPPLTLKEMDFEEAEDELARLNKIIKESYGNDMQVMISDTEKDLIIHVTLNSELQPNNFDTNITDVDNQQMCTLTIDISPKILFEELQISIDVQRPLKVTPQVQFYTNINEKASFTCYVFLNEALEVPSLQVGVFATVVSNLGIPRMFNKIAVLPMKLICEVCQAQKESRHKITLNINQTSVPLAILFPEYVGDDSFSQLSNVVAFKSIAGKPVTILLAKSSERYRLQSDSFASLSILIELMILRLKKHYSNNSDFSVSYTSSLPANELILYVSNHFRIRQQAIQLQENLAQLSAQYRVIQKRLIAKLKVKNPAPLTNLEMLLQDTYSEIMGIADDLEKENTQLESAQTELSCALNVVRNLIKIMDLDEELKKLLDNAFCNTVHDSESQGWEDVMDASLCYLIRTVLAKSDKDKLRVANTSFEGLKDITKLEKRLSQVLERIPKTSKAKEIGNDNDIEDNPAERAKSPEAETIPIPNQFGESSWRLLSARQNLLQRRHKTDN